MAVPIKPRRTVTPGKVPTTSDLSDGEMGVNVADGIIYVREGTNIRVVGTAIRDGVVPMGTNSLAPDLEASNRLWTLPDKDGVIAMVDDIPSLGDDFISGFEIRTTATNFTVGPGRAAIPGAGRIVSYSGTTFNLGRATNAWYHLYIDAAGTVTRQTAAPDPIAYSGVARTQIGHGGRRYIGSIRTVGGSYHVQHSPPSYGSGPVKVMFLQNAALNSRIISAGASTVAADVDMSALAPANTTFSGTFRIQNNSATASIRYYIWTGSAFTVFSNIVGVNTIVSDVNTDTTPKIQYDVPLGEASAFIDLLGYTYYR